MTDSPEDQAEEALREALRKVAAEAAGSTTIEAGVIASGMITPSYPHCDNGPDCQCPFHWCIRAEAAMATYHWPEGLSCPVCGLEITHGDRKHQFEVFPDRTVLTPGPDFDQGIYKLLAEGYEARLRKRRREIADQQALPVAEVTDTTSGWRKGTCANCRLEDEPVKGPAGAELCRWCDELRILAPPPAPAKPPEPARRFSQAEYVLLTSVLLVLAGVGIVMFGGYWPIGVTLWAVGLIYGMKRR